MSDYSWMEEVIRKRPGGNTGSSFFAGKTFPFMEVYNYEKNYF